MAWTAPKLFVAGTVLPASDMNTYVSDNSAAVRAGGLAIASQAAQDFLFASSATQLGRLAAAAGKIPRYTGSAWAMVDYYPVGSIYINANVATNPATLLGFGTWAAFGAGRVMVGLDAGQTEFDVAEETGGAKTHTLTTAEMPVHSHGVTDPGHDHVVKAQTGTGGALQRVVGTANASTAAPIVQDTGNPEGTLEPTGISINNAGSGSAHNNLAPYIVVYMWKRTA